MYNNNVEYNYREVYITLFALFILLTKRMEKRELIRREGEREEIERDG